ncbi:MAG: hypothetical protein ACI9C4_000262 [Paraglaciecola sp.]|jgi:hypothetical protein
MFDAGILVSISLANISYFMSKKLSMVAKGYKI